MGIPVQCGCGKLQGVLSKPEKALRGVCYCKDCQAYAHYLGKADQILDAQGGSDVLAVHPRQLALTQGQDALACMSLSDQGMLRWYASCCRTPLGNTGRDRKMAHLGLLHSCLARSPEGLDQTFGPVRMRVNTGSATAPVRATPLGTLSAVAGFAWSLLRARVSGSYRDNPLFRDDGSPIAAPTVLREEERAALMRQLS
jgi:hypothetical protein